MRSSAIGILDLLADNIFSFSMLRQKVGLLVSFLTAVAGPVTEILLINGFKLYHYNDADFYGIDSWIPWVYFLGGQAVGNLARATLRTLEEKGKDSDSD